MQVVETNYFAYLVRIWGTTDENGKNVWRASVERPDDNMWRGFSDLESLFSFLQVQCESMILIDKRACLPPTCGTNAGQANSTKNE